jgi:hypothetical protein
MTTKTYKMAASAVATALVAATALVGGTAAFAQSTDTTTYSYNGTSYTIPSGYTSYQNGTFYNSSSGMYYNPATGQYSTIAPLGAASTYANGSGYVIPAGYTSSTYGTYYNSSNGMYYDPTTGFYSTNAPTGQAYSSTPYDTTTTTTTTPGLPNTGVDGNTAAATLTFLTSIAFIMFAGAAALMKQRNA